MWDSEPVPYYGETPDERDRRMKWEDRKKITTPLAIGFWALTIGGFFLYISEPDSPSLKLVYGLISFVGFLCGWAWMHLWSPLDHKNSDP